jgi:circadian clock protein KaiB
MLVKKAKTKQSTKTRKTAPTTRTTGQYILRLFVAGATARSHQAVLRVRELCGNELIGRCKLEVIDIYQQPVLTRENQIVATPTLIIQLPLPVRRFIGNLANVTGLFAELDLGKRVKISM